MKTKALIAFFLALPLLSTAHAESNEVVVLKGPKKILLQDSSEANRLHKTITANYLAFGVGPILDYAPGASLGVFLNRNSVLLAEGSWTSHGNSVYPRNFDLGASSVGVHFKQFFGNSFYIKIGVDHRTYSIDERHIDIDPKFNSEIGVDGTSTTANFIIGNQWQWDFLTVGCDWIGFSKPFTYKVKSEKLSGDITQEDKDTLDNYKRLFLSSSTGQLLRFYLGASF